MVGRLRLAAPAIADVTATVAASFSFALPMTNAAATCAREPDLESAGCGGLGHQTSEHTSDGSLRKRRIGEVQYTERPLPKPSNVDVK